MEKTLLGKTGLPISRMGLGGLFVASFATALDQARGAVKAALDCGINYIDTAPGYGDSEKVLGEVLAGESRPLILSTKLGGRPVPFDPKNKAGLRQSVQESLRLLKRDFIDILMIHEPDRPGQYDWWDDWDEVNGPVLELLAELKKQGLVKFTGIGGTTTTQMAHFCRSGKFDVLLTALNYSLLWREAENEVLPEAVRQNMGIIVGSPLHQGALAKCYYEAINDPKVYWLSQPRREQFRQLYALVDECGIPLPELALRFIISNPRVHTVLAGARSAAEAEQNVSSIEKGKLPDNLLKRLDEIAALVPFRPFNEPFGIGWLLPNPRNFKGPGEA
jgi:aryl-alcohol dehydrogenase-like predicted oxidoreductase